LHGEGAQARQEGDQALNREAWLTEIGRRIEPLFRGFKLAKWRATCGWPTRGAVGAKKVVLGQCHGAETSTDGTFELFVSPLIDNPLTVAGVLTHELTHVVAGVKAAHDREFKRIAQHVGLTKGPATQAMPGAFLRAKLTTLLNGLPVYPHFKIKPQFVAKEVKVSRVKLTCVSCGCSATMHVKWLEEPGAPTCGCGGKMLFSPQG
jgi:hypothetical protein